MALSKIDNYKKKIVWWLFRNDFTEILVRNKFLRRSVLIGNNRNVEHNDFQMRQRDWAVIEAFAKACLAVGATEWGAKNIEKIK